MTRPQQQTKTTPSSSPSSSFQFMDSLKKFSISSKNVSVKSVKSMKNMKMFQKVNSYKRLIGRDDGAIESRRERLRDMRHATAKSKSGVWGPTHSFDSDDENDDENDNDNDDGGVMGNVGVSLNKTSGQRSSSGEGTNTTQEESFTSSYEHEHELGGTSRSKYGYRNSPVTQASSKRIGAQKSTNMKMNDRSQSQSQSQYNNGNDNNAPLSPFECSPSGENHGLLSGLWYSAAAAVSELFGSGECNVPCSQCNGNEQFNSPNGNGNDNDNDYENHGGQSTRKEKSGRDRDRGSKSSKRRATEDSDKHSHVKAGTLGIERLSPPSHEISFKKQRSNASSLTDGNNNNNYKKNKNHEECGDDDARAAAKLMAEVAKTSPDCTPPGAPPIEGPGPTGTTKNKKSSPNSPEAATSKNHRSQAPPFHVISIDAAVPFQKSISELTMRSVYGDSITPVSDIRRMAYYAVGKNHGQTKTQRGNNNSNSNNNKNNNNNGSMNGGNRKCYFTGEPIIGGQPFYAGSVQQGLRTLIVFCLPSALGLPKREDLEKVTDNMELSTRSPQMSMMASGQRSTDELSRRTLTGLSTAALSQHDSIYNDDGFVLSELFQSTAWKEDENGNLCESLNADFLLQALPDPDIDLLLTMQKIFPEQFASLSPQLRRPHCWRLYVKFCFFSGLPIADGEMYYKVLDEVVAANSKKNKIIEEIALSHEVMEAVSGESAEILTLPGNKTFQYLQKHYKQQCAKLTPQKLYKKVFDRSSWVRVMPEV